MEQERKFENSFFSKGIVNDANYIAESEDVPEAPEETGNDAQSCCGTDKTDRRPTLNVI